MRPSPRPPILDLQQLSLLPALAAPERLSADERREAVALLAALLIEAGGLERREAIDDERD
jgi:hypothetical protein